MILEVSIDFILNVLSDYIVFRNATVTGSCHLTITTSRHNESIFFFWPEQTSNHFSRSFHTTSLVRPTRCNDFSLTVRESISHLSSHTVKWFSIILKRCTVLIRTFYGPKAVINGIPTYTYQLLSVAESDVENYADRDECHPVRGRTGQRGMTASKICIILHIT